MSPTPFEFTIDCARAGVLRALCAAPLPPGVRARCVRHMALRATGSGALLRARISVRRDVPAALVAAWLRARLGHCNEAWYLDGIPANAGRGPRWEPAQRAGARARSPRLVTRRA